MTWCSQCNSLEPCPVCGEVVCCEKEHCENCGELLCDCPCNDFWEFRGEGMW